MKWPLIAVRNRVNVLQEAPWLSVVPELRFNARAFALARPVMFIVGDHGTIARVENGAVATQEASGTTQTLNGVWVGADGTCHAVGDFGPSFGGPLNRRANSPPSPRTAASTRRPLLRRRFPVAVIRGAR